MAAPQDQKTRQEVPWDEKAHPVSTALINRSANNMHQSNKAEREGRYAAAIGHALPVAPQYMGAAMAYPIEAGVDMARKKIGFADGGQVGLNTASLPVSPDASQNAMPTADNPNINPAFGQVANGAKFGLSDAGQQGAVAQAAPRFDSLVPHGRGTVRNTRTNELVYTVQAGRDPTTGALIQSRADGQYVGTGRPGEYLNTASGFGGVQGGRGDQRVGLNTGEISENSPLSHAFGGNTFSSAAPTVAGRGRMGNQIPAYADGGQVGMQPQGGQPEQPLDSRMADQQISDMLRQNPQVKQQIQQHIQQAIQQGQIDPHLANVAVQLAQACLQNPSLWPQLRQFAVSRGLCGPNDLPQEYDQGLVLVILTAAKAAEGALGGQGAQGNMPDQGPNPMGEMQEGRANGGMIQGPGTGTSDSIPAVNQSTGGPVKVSNGEFIIPADVVAAKGKDFFDGLVRKYHGTVPR